MRFIILLATASILLILYRFHTQLGSINVYAGDDIEVHANEVVTLTAKSSHESIHNEWKQILGPPVSLTAINDKEVTFISPTLKSDALLVFEYKEEHKNQSIHTDNVTVKVFKINSLFNTSIDFINTPKTNNLALITINSDYDINKLLLNINKHNRDSNLPYQLEGNTIKFTPHQPGQYILSISYQDESTQFPFIVNSDFSFNEADIDILNGQLSLDEALGFIDNHFWIASDSLNKKQLKHKINKYYHLNIVGFDPLNGFLISINQDDIEAIQSLQKITRSKSIAYVLPRYFEGNRLKRLEAKKPFYPNDYPNWSNINAENWHLLLINAPLAWSEIQGNPDIYIGISDGGIDANHKELKDKIAINYHLSKKNDDPKDINHGTAVAGSIAAVSHNQYGISGINFLSKLVFNTVGFNGWHTLANHNKIKVVSSSWAITGYIPKEFDLNNPANLTERAENAFKLSRNFRVIAQRHPEKLFVFSSGNGIGNGKGHKGYFGLEGYLHSPALHLSSINTIDKLDNVIFVGALTNKEKLSYSSSYGQLVDVAAPSYYKALSSNNNFKSDEKGRYGVSAGFQGTSASTPVVSGVASLIFSIDPSFSGADVKHIILQSASKMVYERFTNPQLDYIKLEHPLPIIDAYKAVILAKRLSSQKIKLVQKLPNPFQPKMNIQIKGLPNDVKNIASIHKLEGSDEVVENIYKAGKQFYIDLSKMEQVNTISSVVSYTNNDNQEKEVNISEAISFATVTIKFTDQDTHKILNDVEISLESLDKYSQFPSAINQEDGTQKLYLMPGSYKIYSQRENYQNTSTPIHVSSNENLSLKVKMIEEKDGALGIINGVIMDSKYNPIKKAAIKLYSTDLTKPIDLFTVSNDKGFFQIINIPEMNYHNEIISYRIDINADGMTPKTLDEFAIISGETLYKEIIIYKNTNSRNTGKGDIENEDFDTDQDARLDL